MTGLEIIRSVMDAGSPYDLVGALLLLILAFLLLTALLFGVWGRDVR